MNLFSIDEPLVLTLSATAADLEMSITRWRIEAGEKCAIRVLRGWKMSDWAGLYAEFSTALQFPDYFGNNWAALDECLSDLEWIPTEAFLLVFLEAPSILSTANRDDKFAFFRLIARTSHEWSKGREVGKGLYVEAKPFHVIFQARPEDSAKLDAIAKMAEV